MASTPTGMPGRQPHLAPASPRSDAASGHDTDSTSQPRSSKRKFSHTTEAQRQYLLEWLELPGNFALLTKPVKGSDAFVVAPSPSSSPPPKRLKKTDGYRSLAQYMNRVALTEWTEKTARSRFESFMAAYRKAKWRDPQALSAVYRRVDALFGPDGDVESRLRSGSLGQRSEGGRSPLMREVEQEVGALRPVPAEEQTSSPPRRRARTSRSFEEVIMSSTPPTSGGAKEEAVSSPMQELAITSSSAAVSDQPVSSTAAVSDQPVSSPAVTDEALRVESQRLAVRRQELELKQSELRARQEENRQKLRAEVLTRLVEAGKSPAEVREYLAIMDPADTPPPRR